MADKRTKHIEKPELFLNARKPQGELGEKLLDWMSVNHENLARWGVGHLDISDEDVILDIGCGSGVNVARFLEMTKSRVYGIDYSALAVQKSVQLNQKAIDEARCEIIEASVSSLPFDDGSFDIVTAFESIYFWPDITNDFKEVRRVLKDGGIIFICNEAVANSNDERQEELIELLDMKIYSELELDMLLHKAGFSDVLSFVRQGPDSVTHENVTWLCVIAIK